MDNDTRGWSDDRWVANGDRCSRSDCEQGKGCNGCFRYRCFCCHEIISWDEGGTDSEICATCWSDAVIGSETGEYLIEVIEEEVDFHKDLGAADKVRELRVAQEAIRRKM